MDQEHYRLPATNLLPALIVMAKAPRSGAVKTRLTPALSAADAAGFAASCAQDVVRLAQQVARRVIVAFAPADGRDALAPLLPPNVEWLAQRGEDLGERMASAFADILLPPCRAAVMLGTDCPNLPAALVKEAVRALDAPTVCSEQCDVVLGPAEDGGYYLIGLRRVEPGLFEGVKWSTSQTYAQTEANALRLGLSVYRLPPWYDIDTPNDLRRLRAELFSQPDTESCAPNVTRWLRENALSLP